MTEISGQYLEVILPTALQSYDAELQPEDWSDSYLELMELKDQIHTLQETVNQIKDLLSVQKTTTQKPIKRSKPVLCQEFGCSNRTRSKTGLCTSCRPRKTKRSR